MHRKMARLPFALRGIFYAVVMLIFCLGSPYFLGGCSTTKGLEETKNIESSITIEVAAGGVMYFMAPVSTERLSGDQETPSTTNQTITPTTELELIPSKGTQGVQMLKDLQSLKE